MRFISVLLVSLSTISIAEPLTAAEPAKVSIIFHVGDTVESALIALNAKGYRIVYSSALVLPTMTLRAIPKSSSIKELLQEIRSPWQLRAVRTSDEWLIVNDDSNQKTQKISKDPVSTLDVSQSLDTIVVTGSRFGLATDSSSRNFLDR